VLVDVVWLVAESVKLRRAVLAESLDHVEQAG
jgi:hypothetical protein